MGGVAVKLKETLKRYRAPIVAAAGPLYGAFPIAAVPKKKVERLYAEAASEANEKQGTK